MISPRIVAVTISTVFSSLLAEDRVNDPTSFTWNPERSPSGPVIVNVNLQNQTAAVYRDDVLIGSCLISSGRSGYETPTGVFHILEKDADHHSSTYNNASMPYQERLTWGGVALHAGGVPGYPSSHGCIHLPYEFAKDLFEITEMGGTVIVSDGPPGSTVTDGHQIQFKDSDSSEIDWRPHDSPSGPVSIVYSSADKSIEVLRNGVLIGRGEAHLSAFAKKPRGTYTFVLDGWIKDQKNGETIPHWHQVSGPPESHLLKSASHLKMDPRLRHVIESALKPGTTLVMTEDPMTEATRSDPGFQILSGGNPLSPQ
ncbi:MAG: L,D-transpeptidase family protein [Verrucomicrobiales bacterium]|nr:L,D-transpeptidase family protein [Verrucomicrobiales bacterium]